jgi:hypothetical protein
MRPRLFDFDAKHVCKQINNKYNGIAVIFN